MLRDATPRSATLAGGWTVIGMGTFEIWEKNRPLDVVTHNLLFLPLAVLFFVVPVVLFVFGRQVMHFKFRDVFTRAYWKAFGYAAVRGFCWFLGGAAFGIPYFFVLEKILEI